MSYVLKYNMVGVNVNKHTPGRCSRDRAGWIRSGTWWLWAGTAWRSSCVVRWPRAPAYCRSSAAAERSCSERDAAAGCCCRWCGARRCRGNSSRTHRSGAVAGCWWWSCRRSDSCRRRTACCGLPSVSASDGRTNGCSRCADGWACAAAPWSTCQPTRSRRRCYHGIFVIRVYWIEFISLSTPLRGMRVHTYIEQSYRKNWNKIVVAFLYNYMILYYFQLCFRIVSICHDI